MKMKMAVLKTGIVLSIFLLTAGTLYAASGQVVYVDLERGFVVFNLGQEDGIAKNSFFKVYHNGTEIGLIKSVKVRKAFSAADIECLNKGKFIKLGDTVRLSREKPGSVALSPLPPSSRRGKSLLSAAREHYKRKQYRRAEEVVQRILEAEPNNKNALNLMKRIERGLVEEKIIGLCARAEQYLNDKQYEQAEETVKEALVLDSGYKQAQELMQKIEKEILEDKLNKLFMQAERYSENHQYEQAEEAIAGILVLAPNNKRAQRLVKQIKQEVLADKIDNLMLNCEKYFEEMEYELAQEKLLEVLALDPGNKAALEMQPEVTKALRRLVRLEPETITVDINAPKKIIFSSAVNVLKDYGCMITVSDRKQFNLKATKNKKLPLLKDIFSDAGAFTRNKIYYTVELKEAPKSECLFVNRLTVYLRATFDREGQLYNYRVKRSSAAYKEAQDMVCSIKYLAENM